MGAATFSMRWRVKNPGPSDRESSDVATTPKRYPSIYISINKSECTLLPQFLAKIYELI